MQARAQAARQQRQENQAGVLRLPGIDGVDAVAPQPGSYQHVPPWEPSPLIDETLDIDEPDIDPDEIDWDREFGDNGAATS